MPAFICTACGTQYPPSDAPPSGCVICEEERQFVPLAGQGWTTLEALRVRNFNAWRQHEAGLIGIGTEPTFAIGQRALLIQTLHGNVLWDCISLIDDATVTTKVKAALMADSQLKSTQVSVETTEGVVQLSGAVDTKGQESEAVQAASKVGGVKSVKDLLTVRGSQEQ